MAFTHTIRSLSSLVLTALIAGGCSVPLSESTFTSQTPSLATGKTTLRIMHFMSEEGAQKWLTEVIERVKHRFPRLEVEVLVINSDNYHGILRNQISANDPPDVFLLSRLDGSDSMYIKAGLLLDLSDQPFLNRIKGIERQRLNGRIYGMPFDMNGYGVFYNKDVFKKAGIAVVPTTYNAFMQDLEKINHIGINPIAVGYKEVNILNGDLLTDLLVSQLANHPSWRQQAEARQIRFTEDEAIRQALIRLADRFHYVQDRPFETDRNRAAQLVASGEAGMLMNGTWFIDSILSHNPNAHVGMFPFPYSDKAEDNKLPLGSSVGGWAIYKNSPVQSYALALLEEMTTEAMSESLQKNKKAISIFKGNVIPNSYPFEDIQSYIQKKQTIDFTGVITHFSEPFHNAFHQAVTAFLMDQHREVDATLKKLDWEFDQLAGVSK